MSGELILSKEDKASISSTSKLGNKTSTEDPKKKVDLESSFSSRETLDFAKSKIAAKVLKNDANLLRGILDQSINDFNLELQAKNKDKNLSINKLPEGLSAISIGLSTAKQAGDPVYSVASANASKISAQALVQQSTKSYEELRIPPMAGFNSTDNPPFYDILIQEGRKDILVPLLSNASLAKTEDLKNLKDELREYVKADPRRLNAILDLLNSPSVEKENVADLKEELNSFSKDIFRNKLETSANKISKVDSHLQERERFINFHGVGSKQEIYIRNLMKDPKMSKANQYIDREIIPEVTVTFDISSLGRPDITKGSGVKWNNPQWESIIEGKMTTSIRGGSREGRQDFYINTLDKFTGSPNVSHSVILPEEVRKALLDQLSRSIRSENSDAKAGDICIPEKFAPLSDSRRTSPKVTFKLNVPDPKNEPYKGTITVTLSEVPYLKAKDQ